MAATLFFFLFPLKEGATSGPLLTRGEGGGGALGPRFFSRGEEQAVGRDF